MFKDVLVQSDTRIHFFFVADVLLNLSVQWNFDITSLYLYFYRGLR